ncbi:GNAT family N-acetyltransferase [Flavobacterium silvisoli]|nr:GNAT family N-acetyltransferase [Flavobacterium silvisoli]
MVKQGKGFPLQSGLEKEAYTMNFNRQPTHLQNQLLKLIPLQQSNFEELYAVASDPLIWEQHPNRLRYQREVFQNYFEGAMQSEGAFLIRDTKSNEVVGSSRFYDYNEKESSVLIGYTFIGRKFWGNGYNKALKELMLQHAFQFVDKVYFHIGATNYRSQKAIEKTGAVKIDEFEVEYYGEDSKLNFIYILTKP